MDIKSFFKRVFTGDAGDDPELQAARARHNIVVDEDKPAEKRDKREAAGPYNAWDEIDNIRRNFLLGSWATRKFRVVGEDKVKAELEALRKKREEKG
jgi:hypothetical protein